MPKKQQRSRRTGGGSKRAAGTAKASTGLTDAERDRHRDETAAEGLAAERRQLDQQRELRLNMMRSFVTEPLLSQVRQSPTSKFDVIIAINELFKGGVEAALRHVQHRAEEWNVRYSTISYYCFACLTGEQILTLADEARAL